MRAEAGAAYRNRPDDVRHTSPPNSEPQGSSRVWLAKYYLTRPGIACRALLLPQQFRQLGHVGRDPPPLIAMSATARPAEHPRSRGDGAAIKARLDALVVSCPQGNNSQTDDSLSCGAASH
jgi:hypothetical protein